MRTPTFGISSRKPCREAGFTLLELIAVLAIIAIAASAFVYSSTRSVATAEFRSLLVRMQAGLIESRTDAIKGARQVEVIVDAANRRLDFSGRTLQLPKGVDLDAKLAESTRTADGAYAIIFFPDGTSSGGSLNLSFRGRIFQLRVNWLTGSVSTHEA